MTENDFDMLIKRTISEHISEYIPETELDYTPHKFSRKFEQKMNKLMGKFTAEKHISVKKIIVYITAAIIAATLITSCARVVREKFISFITNIFSTHTEVISVVDENSPLEFTDIYEITADMSDFELKNFLENEFKREYVYGNEHCMIFYSQYIKEYYDVSVNTEGYEMEEISINGYNGFYLDLYNQNGKSITWDNGDYVISIFVTYDNQYDFSKNEIINMAESVQKMK